MVGHVDYNTRRAQNVPERLKRHDDAVIHVKKSYKDTKSERKTKILRREIKSVCAAHIGASKKFHALLTRIHLALVRVGVNISIRIVTNRGTR